jgi:hypothetical protein
MNETSSTRDVSLPTGVVSRVEERLPHTEFTSVEDYIAYVLEEVLAEVDDVDEDATVDESEVQERLKSLGYLNE